MTLPYFQIVLQPIQQCGRRPMETGGYSTVEMTFTSLDDGKTMLQISEGPWPSTQEGLNASYKNCQGWQHMMTCLRGYIMYGIDLRK